MKVRFVLLMVSLLAFSPYRASCEQASSEDLQVSGVLEHYFWTYAHRSHLRFSHHARYLHLRGQLSPAIGFAAGLLEHRGVQQFDENHLEFHQGNLRWRIGRFRSAYGHSDWSECYYTGFVQTPLLRTMHLGPNLRLNRLDTGIDVAGGTGATQYQFGWIDVQPGVYELLPLRPNHLVGRMQFYQGDTIVGLNVLLEPSVWRTKGTHLWGLDWRWSVPHLQMRGEYVWGSTLAGRAQGYYLGLFYHPAELKRTTFLGRTEAMRSPVASVGAGELFTMGIKQILSPLITLSLTYSWGSGMASREARGWALQWVTFTRF